MLNCVLTVQTVLNNVQFNGKVILGDKTGRGAVLKHN